MLTSKDIEKIKNETLETPEVLIKWQNLLKDVSGPEKEIVAWMLENQERSMRSMSKFSLTLSMKNYPRNDFESLESQKAMIENAVVQYLEENFSRKEGVDFTLKVEQQI